MEPSTTNRRGHHVHWTTGELAVGCGRLTRPKPAKSRSIVYQPRHGVGNSWRDRDQNATKVDGPATYESKGVGFISACPDPDGAGAKIAILSADKKRCFQSGYQEKGIAGDQEFHARLNNDSAPGMQTVVWCYDANRNGCSDEYIKDTITITWTQ